MPHDEWEIWLDTQISPIIAKWMAEHTGYIVRSSYTLQTTGMSDLDIYRKAKEHGKVIIISKDADFSELVVRLGSPPKLVNLKIGNFKSSILWKIIKPQIINVIAILVKTEMTIIDLEH